MRPEKLTKEHWEALLTTLADDRQHAARRYLDLHEKLIDYFRWNRSPQPEEDADETLNRMARRAAEGEAIAHSHRYALGIARFVLMESNQSQRRAGEALAVMSAANHAQENREPEESPCLESCLHALPAESQWLIFEYYSGCGGDRIRHRQGLAARLGIGVNALRNRALRLRKEMEGCIGRCLEQGVGAARRRS